MSEGASTLEDELLATFSMPGASGRKALWPLWPLAIPQQSVNNRNISAERRRPDVFNVIGYLCISCFDAGM
jgi:hypothetical protein